MPRGIRQCVKCDGKSGPRAKSCPKCGALFVGAAKKTKPIENLLPPKVSSKPLTGVEFKWPEEGVWSFDTGQNYFLKQCLNCKKMFLSYAKSRQYCRTDCLNIVLS